ncbi:MAG: aminopeptidase, partial [Oscillospiraceae bacterium]
MADKTKGQLLADELLIQRKNGAEIMSDEEIKKADNYCEGYKTFLDNAKTEREAVTESIKMAKAKGFTEFDRSKKYVAGDKVYLNNRGKALILAVIGSEPIQNGVNIMASHIDSPRVDIKACPLYEDSEMAFLKTHYYGGIKKYQWTTVPLSLHGVVVKRDGTKVEINLGEDDKDPQFLITDLLLHLWGEQSKRPAADVIRGEEMNILIGSRPFKDDSASEKVKLNIMRLINEKYGILEKDFLTAELTMVPAMKARDIGFDRSLIGGYGQDDRVCAYTSLCATLEAEKIDRTIVTVLADKEETGSYGNTGLDSSFMEYFIADLAKPYGIDGRLVLSNSKCLSADVSAGFDPTFSDVSEKLNNSFMNYGVVVTKYTGSRGKSGTSDASAEFTNEVARVLDKHNVIWQTGELGKVDAGGGGTVAKYIAALDVDVV